MKNITTQNQVQVSAEQMANSLMGKGLKCYCVARRWYVIWVPWEQKAINVCDTQTIKRYFGITDGRFASKVAYHCMDRREVLEVPDKIAKQFPMPVSAWQEKYPTSKDLLKWAQTILIEIDKQKRN